MSETKRKEKAIKVIWLTETTKKRFKIVLGRDLPDDSASEFQDKLLDLWETAKRQEETGED